MTADKRFQVTFDRMRLTYNLPIGLGGGGVSVLWVLEPPSLERANRLWTISVSPEDVVSVNKKNSVLTYTGIHWLYKYGTPFTMVWIVLWGHPSLSWV